MKTIPILLQRELERTNARLATCMRLVRRDGNVYCFTTNRKALVIDGETYYPTHSFTASDIATGSNLDKDDLSGEGLLMSATLSEDELRAGRWDFCYGTLFRCNWASPSDGVEKMRAFHMGKATVGAQTFKLELLGLIESYETSVGEITQPGCRTSLGTAECGVTPTSVTGTIDLCETDFFTLTDATRTEADGFFDEGVITFTSGIAIGLSYEIKAYIVGLFVTKTAVAYDVTGASYTMTEGCARTWPMCTGRFNNGKNFRGEPWLRGNDVLVQVGRHE